MDGDDSPDEAHVVYIKFDDNMYLSGYTAAIFGDAQETAFIAGLASAVELLEEGDITVNGISDYTARRRWVGVASELLG